MPSGFKTEASVRRFFRDHGSEVVSLRYGKHWTVFTKPIGTDRVSRFTLSGSTRDGNMLRIVKGDLRRASVDRNNTMKGF